MIRDEQIVDVSASEWVGACLDQRERGLCAVDWLTAVDAGETLLVLVHLVEPGTGNEVIVRTAVGASEPRVESLVEFFPSADWHERETTEMFGIDFMGRESTPALLLRAEATTPPLRRDSPLTERVNTAWPGEEESKSRRRRKLPPGVREEWVVSDE